MAAFIKANVPSVTAKRSYVRQAMLQIIGRNHKKVDCIERLALKRYYTAIPK